MSLNFTNVSDLIDRYEAGERNFQYMKIEGENLDNIELSGVNLSRALLYNCVICQASLTGVNLANASIRGCIFKGTNLSGADLSDTLIYESDFSEVNCIGSIFKRADLSDLNLQKANFTGANFSNASFNKLKLAGVNFTQSNLSIVYVKNTDWEDAILTDAIVSIRKGSLSSYHVCVKCGGDAHHTHTTFTGGAFGSGNTDADIYFSCYDCGHDWYE